MASSDAKPIPLRNTAHRIYFGYHKNDGSLITSLSSGATRVIKDGTDGAASGTTTQVGTTGVYYLDLTAGEMDTDCTVVKFSDATSGAIPVIIALFPEEAGDFNRLVDDLLKRDMSAVTGESSRSPLNAFRKLRNKWSISGSTVTYTKEDDSTSAFTSAITTTGGASPITAEDPS
jgi:hypothetical protein